MDKLALVLGKDQKKKKGKKKYIKIKATVNDI